MGRRKVSIFFALATSLGITPVLGHGSADWIRQHPDFSYCCNERDCHAISPATVTLNGDTYSFAHDGKAYLASESEAKPSIDHRFWACIWDGKVRCFFRPLLGS
jgi:hypothetical protein